MGEGLARKRLSRNRLLVQDYFSAKIFSCDLRVLTTLSEYLISYEFEKPANLKILILFNFL